MRPSVPILRLPDAHGLDVPRYADGVGTTLALQAAISVPLKLDVGQSALIPTGFAFTIPLGMEAQVRSHKELSETTGLIVLNAPVTIDSSNQNEIKVLLYNKGENSYIVRRGQEIASLVFSPVLRVKWDEVNPPQEKGVNEQDVTLDFAQSKDDGLTSSVVKEALKQVEKNTSQDGEVLSQSPTEKTLSTLSNPIQKEMTSAPQQEVQSQIKTETASVTVPPVKPPCIPVNNE